MYAFPLCFNLIYNDQYKLLTYFQATKDCVAKTLKRLEEKIHGRVSFFYLLFPCPSSFCHKIWRYPVVETVAGLCFFRVLYPSLEFEIV
jgi:hypothetical protein